MRYWHSALILAGLALMMSACTTLPTGYERVSSSAIQDTDSTRLGRGVAPVVNRHPGKSGLEPLFQGTAAFAARWLLADLAERSLDIQYYLWHDDDTGKLLLRQLLRAADRGVRVRLLIDDISTGSHDLNLAVIDQHPRVEVRLFNPFIARKRRMLEGITSFRRVNRRMHNKSFTADNQITIVGGRNIGDMYFEARSDVNYADFDVMAVGPVVRAVSSAFDAYWNSEFAVPIGVLEESGTSRQLMKTRAALEQHTDAMRDSEYIAAVRGSAFISQLERGDLLEYWGEAEAVYDDPGKAAARPGAAATYVKTQMRPVVLATNSELFIISAYFVPGKEGMRVLRQLRERGVRIRIVTNSLGSNDVPIVHAGYARYRKPMLREGIELHETKLTAVAPGRKSKHGLGGSSQASLHSKAYIFDRNKVFVGSFNLDPRSRHINTELGILFEDSRFAESIAVRLDAILDRVAYSVVLGETPDPESGGVRSRLEWVTSENGEEVRLYNEPNTSIWRRMSVWFMSLLPIEGQL